MPESNFEDRLKSALEKDFKRLYQKEFTTDWREQRIVRRLEIGVMSLESTLAAHNEAVASELEQVMHSFHFLPTPPGQRTYSISADYLRDRIATLRGGK